MVEAIPIHPQIDYCDLADYMRAFPDKVADWLAHRIVDDDMKHIAEEFYEVAREPSYFGPDIELWR